MLDRWRDGIEVVYAARTERNGETRFKKTTATWFYRLLSSISPVPMTRDSGDFRLLDRRALDALASFSHVPLQIATLVGFSVAAFAFLMIPVAIVFRILGQFVPGVTTK